MRKRNKPRYAAAAFSTVLAALCALELAGNLELLLTQRTQHLTLAPLRLFAQLTQRGFLLWGLFSALGLLGIWWALFGSATLDYHSRMYEVVPGFEIPMPEGQGQHGTAWWLERRDYGRVFDAVDTASPVELPEELAQRYQEERGEIGRET